MTQYENRQDRPVAGTAARSAEARRVRTVDDMTAEEYRTEILKRIPGKNAGQADILRLTTWLNQVRRPGTPPFHVYIGGPARRDLPRWVGPILFTLLIIVLAAHTVVSAVDMARHF